MVVVGVCWNCSPATEAAESVVIELNLDINPSELQGDVSEVGARLDEILKSRFGIKIIFGIS
jgi:ABC-type phosphate/phosphonate transport system substrate-binding protein